MTKDTLLGAFFMCAFIVLCVYAAGIAYAVERPEPFYQQTQATEENSCMNV